nr:MoaD/ThiS family protein [Fundidesulfovibrio soli]
MPITVNCFATLAPYSPPGGQMDIAPGMTAGKLVDLLGIPRDGVKILFVNGLRVDLDTPLKDGDRVGMFPAVAGG